MCRDEEQGEGLARLVGRAACLRGGELQHGTKGRVGHQVLEGGPAELVALEQEAEEVALLGTEADVVEAQLQEGVLEAVWPWQDVAGVERVRRAEEICSQCVSIPKTAYQRDICIDKLLCASWLRYPMMLGLLLLVFYPVG